MGCEIPVFPSTLAKESTSPHFPQVVWHTLIHTDHRHPAANIRKKHTVTESVPTPYRYY